MGIIDSLKDFFGLSKNEHKFREPSGLDERYPATPDHSRREQNLPLEEEKMGINIYSSPLEIAKFFEHQMEAMMKNMRAFSGMEQFEDFFNNSFHDNPGMTDIKILKPPHEDQNSGSNQADNLRDQFLKPGYKKQDQFENKSDDDLDGRINMNDVDEVFRRSDSKVMPYRERPKFHFYGQSVTSRTIRRPDGVVETHRTVRDQEGNEETTITQKFGDKEYTVTTRVDKNGHKEIEENMVNIDESEKNQIFKQDSVQGSSKFGSFLKDWSDFEHFFK
ncbi:uncharacterized protein LOC108736600 [Agrilus planipennis]|uniref:Uncharacterized protein LOC108736600 n=1 Tax=Agrilus planipennis TaxID=224129 RepID=A0A1W4WKW0_AGRPL|nr:uncharacterized protein LOC108736600 [Agrilus planipennis]